MDERTLEQHGYEYVMEFGEYGYDWSITVFYKRDGRFFYLHDSGCSCDSFGDTWSDVHSMESDLKEVTSLPAALDLWRSRYDGLLSTAYTALYDAGLR